MFAQVCCAALYVLCLWVHCLHSPVDWLEVFLQAIKNYLTTEKNISQIVKSCRMLRIPIACLPLGLIPNAMTMTTLSAGFPVTLDRVSILFQGQPRSRSLHLLRTVVLFFVELVCCDGWVYNFAGSLPDARHAIVCIPFTLEQSQVVEKRGC